MKIARPPTREVEEEESGPLLQLVIAHSDKHLQRLVLSYCYHSAIALKRCCKALYALFHFYEEQQSFWRYGIQLELRARLAAWPAVVVDVMCECFDPFFDAWPAEQPGRPPKPQWDDALRWIWDESQPNVRAKDGSVTYSIGIAVRYSTLRRRTKPHLALKSMLAFHFYKHNGNVKVSSRWWRALGGADGTLSRHWCRLNGSLTLSYWYSGSPRARTALWISQLREPETFWVCDDYDADFTGWRTPIGAIVP